MTGIHPSIIMEYDMPSQDKGKKRPSLVPHHRLRPNGPNEPSGRRWCYSACACACRHHDPVDGFDPSWSLAEFARIKTENKKNPGRRMIVIRS